MRPYCVPRRHALRSLHLLVDDVSCTVTVEKIECDPQKQGRTAAWLAAVRNSLKIAARMR
jgi:hypothetical protein